MNELEVVGRQAAVSLNGTTAQQVKTRYVTAVSVQKPRQFPSVVQGVLEEARYAGSSFFYGWPVKNRRTGQVTQVEGASIGMAMAIARHYGNCAVEVDVSESDTHYLFTAHFVDLETGFTCSRLYRQRKAQPIGLEDADRVEDIAFQIGQSKAIRNAVLRAVPDWLVDEAIKAAKEAELAKIKPENLVLSRARVLDFFARYGVTKERMEAALNKPMDAWDPQDIVNLRGQATALKEGRITASELFPPLQEPEAQKESPESSKSSGAEKIKRVLGKKRREPEPPQPPPQDELPVQGPDFDVEGPIVEDEPPVTVESEPVSSPLEALQAALKSLGLSNLLREREEEVRETGRDWDRELQDLLSMPAMQAAATLRAWDIARKARARFHSQKSENI